MQSTSSSSQILLYTGLGTDPTCVRLTNQKLHSLIDDKQHTIREIQSLSHIYSFPNNTRALCIPGGNVDELTKEYKGSLSMLNLSGLMKRCKISYWGICSGAIFGTTEKLHRKEDSVFYENKFRAPSLKLYPGQCLVPLYSTEKPEVCSLLLNNEESAYSINFKGPAFLINPEDPYTTVLSTYQNIPKFSVMRNPNQIVSRELFKNAVLEPISENMLAAEILYQPPKSPPVYLSGIRLEMDAAFVKSYQFKKIGQLSDIEQKDRITQLTQDGLNQDEILRSRLQMLHISCKV